MRELIYYCTISLDGYVADAEGSTSWMHGAANEDYGFAEFYSGVSALLLGRKTYEQMLDTGDFFPYADKPVYVFSSNANLKRAADNVQIVSDVAPEVFVARLKLQDLPAPNADAATPPADSPAADAPTPADPPTPAAAGPLWLGGGARLASTLLAAGLVDELQLHIQPILLGAGLPLVSGPDLRKQGFDLRQCAQKPGGFVKLRYRTVKSWRTDM
ncbi:MAG: dihydrofolate reductase family protein [Coriobacteriia bacterium]|nr:dihydrofolate reductase family protein [Coriobacteriia bacterium]